MSQRYERALSFLEASTPIAPPRPDADQDDQYPFIDPSDPDWPYDDDEDEWDPADN